MFFLNRADASVVVRACMHAVDHRNIVRSKVLLREMWLETMHSFNQNPKRSFASKGG